MKNTLLTDFYTELTSTFNPQKNSEFQVRILLHAVHPIFKGHFPQAPVTPGVCLTQIIKEILMEKLQQELMLCEGDNIKFLGMIDPNKTPELEVAFQIKNEENTLGVNASFSNGETTFMKFKGRFVFVQ